MANDDSNIEWIFSFETDYTDIGSRDGVTFYGRLVTDDVLDDFPSAPGASHPETYFQITGFEVIDFETFWEEAIESDQAAMDKLLALSEEAFGEQDLDRIFFIANREPEFANIVVRGWIETAYEGDDIDPFNWVISK